MKVAVTGASGLIGSALVPALRARGHEVVRLVRRAPSAPDEVRWDPAAGTVDLAGLQGIDAVVHLAGAGVGDKRWTEAYKKEIRDSRVQGTTTIAQAMASLDPRPKVLVCGSAIGYYGDTGDRAVTEESPQGAGFLADVVADWEASAKPAIDAGIRVPFARTGLVVSSKGGAWKRLLPIFRLGVGGKVGSGKQYWSFISLRDEVAALIALLEDERYRGPVNLTAPNPVTNAEVTAAMGRVLGRPTVLPVPAFAIKAALGEFSQDVLGSQRVLPQVLEGDGFNWSDPTIDQAIQQAASGS
ncbi:MAG: TIGR01777 family protein [Actinomycetales bacterium mxb001]|nr:MAG: TIGR01777 family protein [Actinomycetales bacterium mxb001]